MTGPLARSSRRGDLLRRYPSLAFVALSVALAATLPSALNLPTSGPTELAELAPVPPEDDVPPQQGDVSALGEAGSEGLGAGPGSGAAPPPPPPPPAGSAEGPDQSTPVLKRCVGDPPRQTEDPLSPSCVAFFDGDNGGATAPGVTADEVRVLIVTSGGASTAGQVYDYDGEVPNHDNTDTAIQAYQRYFNDRYQTWNRRVRFYGMTVSPADTPEQVRSSVSAVEDAGPFFAVVAATPHSTEQGNHLAVLTAHRGIFSVTYDGLLPDEYASAAPRLWSFRPDVATTTRLAASFLCDNLVGRPPQHAGGTTADGEARHFGILWTDEPEEPQWRVWRDLLLAAIDAVPGCAPPISDRAIVEREDLATAMADFRLEGATTLVPLLTSNRRTYDSVHAGGQAGWQPEWFVAGVPGLDDRTFAGLYNQEQWSRAYGVSTDYARGRPEQQPFAIALRDACPSCSDDVLTSTADRAYNALALLFRAIQAAGPELTFVNAERGMRSIPPYPSPTPLAPAAYFTPGNHSFLKDAMALWWDAGSTPEGGDGVGCYRLVRSGQRHRVGEWPTDWDDRLFVTGSDAPCDGKGANR